MNQYATNTELKNVAKDLMLGHYIQVILLFVLKGCIVLVAQSVFTRITSQSLLLLSNLKLPFTSVILYIATYFVSFLLSSLIQVFQVGFTLFFLCAASGKPTDRISIFYGFFHDFGKCFALSAIATLISYICTFPLEYVYQTIRTTRSVEIFLNPVVMACVAVGLIIWLYLSLGLSQCYFLLLDFPNYSVKQIITTSFRIMKGHKKRLLILETSFLPLMLLEVLTLGIGFLWITPYMNMTYTLFFLDLMNPRVKKEEVSGETSSV